MPIAKNNFTHATNDEFEGVKVSFFTVDFINSMASETGDLSAGGSTAGLEGARATINGRLNILGEGPLADGNTQKTYMVRADALDGQSSTTTLASLQADLRAYNGSATITATISSATVTGTGLAVLTAAAV